MMPQRSGSSPRAARAASHGATTPAASSIPAIAIAAAGEIDRDDSHARERQHRRDTTG